MQTTHVLKTAILMLSICTPLATLHGQEGQSLADVARKLRAQKATTTQSNDASSGHAPAPKPEPAKPEPAKLEPPIPAPAKTAPATPHDATYDSALDATNDSDQYIAGIGALLEAEKFKALDDHANAVRSSQSKFTGSGWKLYTFYLVVTNALAGDVPDSTFEANIKRLTRWSVARPQSVTARVALASAYLGWAWKGRTGEYADKVNDENWRLFEERVGRAEQILMQAAALPEKCPEWYVQMQQVARAQGWDKARVDALLEEAIALAPDYFYTYEEHARFLLPQWYGEEGEAARFAERIANRIGGKKGDVIYFRIAAALDCNCTTETYLSETSWPRIKLGYQALEELYGFSNIKLNEICYMAVKSGDAQYAAKLFDRIGDQWNEPTWQTRQIFDDRKAWAAKTAEVGDVYQAVDLSERSPEGKAYHGKIATLLGSPQEGPFSQCFAQVRESAPVFEVMLKIAKDGTVKRHVFFPDLVPVACMGAKLATLVFPAPPADDYWVRVRMQTVQ